MAEAGTGHVRLHAVLEGRVQGVGFRYFVRQTADDLGLCGWVRNRRDGVVEVLAEGPHAALLALKGALQRGPRSAFVSKVDEVWLDATGEFRSFEIRMTA